MPSLHLLLPGVVRLYIKLGEPLLRTNHGHDSFAQFHAYPQRVQVFQPLAQMVEDVKPSLFQRRIL